MTILRLLTAATLFAMALGGVQARAQTSPLYLVDSGGAIVVQNGVVTGTFSSGLTEVRDTAVAVSSTIRTYGQNFNAPYSGAEYTLAGNFTGTTYTNTLSCCVRDGTTDGTYNYAIVEPGGGLDSLVYRFGLDWSNPEIVNFDFIFPDSPQVVHLGRPTGITWDPRDNSFWFAQQGFLFNISADRAFIAGLIGSPSSVPQALAFDPADNTLWLSTFTAGQGSFLIQYDATKTIDRPVPLTVISGLGAFSGAEFALLAPAVPEPATWMTMILGFGMIGGAVRYRKRKLARA